MLRNTLVYKRHFLLKREIIKNLETDLCSTPTLPLSNSRLIYAAGDNGTYLILMLQEFNATMPVKWAREWISEETSEWCVYCSAWHGPYLADLQYVIKAHPFVSHPQAGVPLPAARWIPRVPALHPIPTTPQEEREFLFSTVAQVIGSDRVMCPRLNQSLGPGKYHCSDWLRLRL